MKKQVLTGVLILAQLAMASSAFADDDSSGKTAAQDMAAASAQISTWKKDASGVELAAGAAGIIGAGIPAQARVWKLAPEAQRLVDIENDLRKVAGRPLVGEMAEKWGEAGVGISILLFLDGFYNFQKYDPSSQQIASAKVTDVKPVSAQTQIGTQNSVQNTCTSAGHVN